MKAEFMLSVADKKQLPKEDKPEIAFAGRSNVGKSSLINKILDRKNLVKTGKTPGKTRLINFFNINEQAIFVDLPGYGYAKVSKKEKQQWGKLIEDYFQNRENLVICFILIDIRRSMEQEEKDLLDTLYAYGITPFIILTKSDKLSKNQLNNNKFRLAKETGIDVKKLIHFSAVTGDGKKEIQKLISSYTYLNWN